MESRYSRVIDIALALDATPLGLAAVLCVSPPG
jgi:hypothetical protein